MENITTLNLDKICRVCLLESERMYSIFSDLYEDQTDAETSISYIYEILISVSSIKIQADDGLPSMICTDCMDMAHTSLKFQKQCNQSQIILNEYIKRYPPIKDSTENKLSSLEGFSNNSLVQNSTENVLDPNHYLIKEEEKQIIELPQQNVEEGTNTDEGDENETEDNTLREVIQVAEEAKTENSDTSYSCTLCDKSYKFPNSLRVHMRNHTQERPYACEICNKSFKQYSSLSNHQKTHTGEQPYSCKICGKRYKQSGTLTAHMRVHTGQRPFLCSICGRGFRQASDLGYHMRSHTKEKPYMCNICGKTMSMQSHLVQHMRIHTGERPYKCNVCEKAFPSSTRLKRHTIIHTSLKPYTCEVCSKSFNRRSSLKVHSKIHTDERSHVCTICSKGFIQAHALKSHLLSHSSELTIKSVQYVV